MTGRSPARLLAPLALAAAAVALFAVISSTRQETASPASGAGERPAATATPAATEKPSSAARRRVAGRTYTVKPGDTPSAIAQRENVDLAELLQANPDADPSALTPGQELQLP